MTLEYFEVQPTVANMNKEISAIQILIISASMIVLALYSGATSAQTFRFTSTQHDIEFPFDPGAEDFPTQIITSDTGVTFSQSRTDSEEIWPFTYDPGQREMRSDARTDWGVNGVVAQVLNVPSDHDVNGLYGAYALSMWSDAFIVTSGAPIGALDFSGQLDGMSSGNNAGFTYAVLYASRPFTSIELLEWLDDEVTYGDNGELRAPTGTALAFGRYQLGGEVENFFSAVVPYTRGETVYVVSILEASALGATSKADFYNSAYFGVRAPDDATLMTSSGFSYTAAVPETSTVMMSSLGVLCLIGVFSVRRRVHGLEARFQ